VVGLWGVVAHAKVRPSRGTAGLVLQSVGDSQRATRQKGGVKDQTLDIRLTDSASLAMGADGSVAPPVAAEAPVAAAEAHLLQLTPVSQKLSLHKSNGVDEHDGSTVATEKSCSMPGESVITQVTTRDANQTIQRPESVSTSYQAGVPSGDNATWKRKFRSLLCCLAPSHNEGYFRADGEALAAAARRTANCHAFNGPYCIPPLRPELIGKKTLVLDLDETLVHSSFKPVPNPDYVIPVEIDNMLVDVYVLKRPWYDYFMKSIAPHFEIVVFTASLAKYADPLLDMMDTDRIIHHRLFRESCCLHEGNYVKDLCCLGRSLGNTIIVDNSPHSFVFQPECAVPIGPPRTPFSPGACLETADASS